MLPPEHPPAGAGPTAATSRHATLFREVNHRVRGVAARSGPDQPWEFFCECGRLCGETLLLAVEEYDRIRRKRRRFVLCPGHEDEAVERVIERHETWIVVELPPPGRRPRAGD